MPKWDRGWYTAKWAVKEEEFVRDGVVEEEDEMSRKNFVVIRLGITSGAMEDWGQWKRKRKKL
jgi:hypothetical protein